MTCKTYHLHFYFIIFITYLGHVTVNQSNGKHNSNHIVIIIIEREDEPMIFFFFWTIWIPKWVQLMHL